MQLAVQSGILDISIISKEIEMKRKRELLAMHPYEVTQLPNGKWQTYFPDEKKGRVLKRRKTISEINDIIIEYWENHEHQEIIKDLTFKEAYHKYINFQYEKVKVSPNTYCKYQSNYKRFFENTEFNDSLINSIDSEDIRAYITSITKEKGLRIKALKELMSLLKGTFKYCFAKKYINENPIIYIETKEFTKYCIKPVVRKEDRVLINSEPIQLYNEIIKRIQKNKYYMGNYAVLLSLYTGMRVGELAALSWEDIYEDYIIVRNEEIFNRITKEVTIEDYTKNRAERIIPITDNIKNVLEQIKEVQSNYKYSPQYLFNKKDGTKMTAHQISDIVMKRTKQAGFTKRKSVHAIRRTVNSSLIQNGVPTVTRISLMGHTAEVNENNYSYDLTDIKIQKKLLSEGTNYEKAFKSIQKKEE